MYLYPNRHAPSGAGLLKKNSTNASALFLTGLFMKMFLLSALLASQLLLLAEESRGQELDKVIISLNVKDAPLKQVFKKIEKQTSFYFTYLSQDVNKLGTVSYSKDKISLAQALRDILKNTGLSFEQADKNILIKRSGETIAIITEEKNTVEGTIRGKITDTEGKALNGATILIKGTQNGTSTNEMGNFVLNNVPDGNVTLVITAVGYTAKEIAVSVSGGQSVAIDIKLSQESREMGEVVVVAYGTSTKKASTGAIQTINAKELQDIPVPQITQKLQGKLAGVQINQITGKPGQGMQVRIRGQASILAGSDPLYVVDGFPIVGDISNINPDEIENISVLKDASSTSLYGSRAANGVVLITTKMGKSGQTNIGVNTFYGVQQVPQKGRPEMMNGQEFAQFKKESFEDLGLAVPAPFQTPSQYGEGYNWYDGMLQSAPIQNYSISINTSRDRFTTSAVAGFFNQDGVLRNSDFKRFSLRLNSEYKVSDKIKVGFNAAPSYSIDNTPSSDGAFYASFLDPSAGGILNNSLLVWPVLPYKNSDGSLPLTAFIPGVSAFATPNYYRALNEVTNETKTSRLISNAYVEYAPIKGLSLKSTINADIGNSAFLNFKPSTASVTFVAPPPSPATSIRRNDHFYSWLNENLITYRKSYSEHNFEVLGGFTTQKFRSEAEQLRLSDFPDDRIRTVQSAINIDRTQSFSDIQEWSLTSFIARINYNYGGKYLLTAAIRRDGSSRFGSDNRWGNFPSVSAGWVISDEKFMAPIKAVSFLKLRASYGVIGNNNIGNYTQYATVNTTTNAIFGSAIAPGASVVTLGNNDLGWETTKQLDIGIDLGLFKNRLNIAYDYYTKKTTNLLYNVAVPQESGFTNFNGNIGELKFWGHEFTVSSKNLTGSFKWNTNFNISFNDNKVVKLSEGVDRLYGGFGNFQTITMVGRRIGQFWGLIQEGVYVDQTDFNRSPKATASQVGTVKYRDVNGDGIITYGGDNDDRTFIGNPFPKFIYGITNSFSYKNFDLNIVGSGSHGNDVAVMTDQGATNLDGVFNVQRDIKDRWRSPSNPGKGRYGKTTAATFMERDWFSTRFVSKGNFFTIKNVTLGYNVPLKENKYVRNVRVYGSVQQAYIFTNYRGVNPEVSTTANGTNGSTLNLGMDWGTYPVPRTYSFGINVGL
jgi:TonB-linked SusC/RagA family outer membrane protein